MSNVTTIYNTLLTSLASLFSSRTRIANPYSIEDNTVIFLKKGYGLKIGSSSVGEGEFCTYVYDLNVSVTLTNQVVKLESSTDAHDDPVKELLEASNTLQDAWLDGNQIGIESSISKVDFNGTSEVNFVNAGKNNFVTMDVSFIIQIREDL